MRKTELKINLSNLNHNINLIKKFTNADIQAVVKANSYGLNVAKVLQTIEDEIESYSVITLSEAVEVRKLTKKPILLLQGVYELDDYELIEKYKLDFVIHSSWQLNEIEKYNLSNSRIWLKINTGMNRLGIDLNDFEELFKKVQSLNTREVVLMSHLSASSDKYDPHTLSQIKIFNNLVDGISCKKSLSNSGAIFNMPEAEHDIVRPGMAIYGGKYNEFGTKNVSSLTSQIISLRNIKAGDKVGYDGSWEAKEDCIIGSIPIGYADGLPYFKKPVTVSVNGKEFKTAGKLNMDLTLINLEQDSSIKIGDTVTFWDFNSDLSKVSEEFNTISYNLLTNISSRVTKNYLE
tara:strand:+ start:1859 stop:2902 length:1044 start_codon:yes stop_codon:yes gene_type:complete